MCVGDRWSGNTKDICLPVIGPDWGLVNYGFFILKSLQNKTHSHFSGNPDMDLDKVNSLSQYLIKACFKLLNCGSSLILFVFKYLFMYIGVLSACTSVHKKKA